MDDTPILRRFIALVFDLFIAISMFCGIILLVQYLEFEFPIKEFVNRDREVMFKAYLLFAGFYLLYELFFSALLSTTPGKITVNAEDEYYRGHTFVNVFIRSLLKTITVMLGPLMMAISLVVALTRKSSQVIHDLAARTRVTEETRNPRLIGLFFIIAAIALFAYFYSKNLKDLIFDLSDIHIPALYE
jgi:uncharacterized RDD family membrane protein YckC